jgi:diguanylate cyclase (GGDEF)-like protein
MNNTVYFLGHVSIFSLLKPSERQEVLDSIHLIEIEKGTTIFKEGEDGSTLYIVKSGKISISIRLSDGKEREIAEFSGGDFFGEMSIFENAPRSATCTTKEKSILYSLHAEDFFDLIECHPYIAIKIMYRMLNIASQRLRNTSEFLSDMVLWGERARKRAITDRLTGVYNRRFLEDALDQNFVLSIKNKKPFSLIMVDLDHFREINEQYGDRVGDKILLSVVGVFQGNLRKQDVIARYGGDEFTILLPNTDVSTAQSIAQKICNEVANLDLLKNLRGPIDLVTTSQGLATFPLHAESLHKLREMADEALYRAKNEGRNRVIVWN